MLKSKSTWNFNQLSHDTNHFLGDTNELSPIMKELLLQRGITTQEEADTFLNPNLDYLLDPATLHHIDKAKNRINQAIKNQEKILVYGDYDADGVSSTTVLLKTLQEMGAQCDYYIPNRFTEGYGPNEAAFMWASNEGFSLIITVDNGIAAINEAKKAKELGIDLIITDHHEIQAELPDAFAIIHPKVSPNYDFKELAGVGVAFKLAQYLLGYFPEHLLAYVAIGTIADMVPLVGENRILAFYGLKQLGITTSQGLKALKQKCDIEGKVTEEDIGFKIGPRLNAVGRLQDADLAVSLLLAEEREEADEFADIVHQLNKERQQIVATIVEEAEKMVDTNHTGVIVVGKEGWNEGVVGIVASRLVKKYDRPAIVLCHKPDQGIAKGSARSIPAFDLFSHCMEVRDLFTHFGGHAQAAGMSMPLENVAALRTKLSTFLQDELSDEDCKQEIVVAKTITIPEINEVLVEEISALAPFGMHNPKPVFHLKAKPTEIRQLGSKKNHLKLQFKQDTNHIEGIGFGLGDLYPYITKEDAISIVGEIGVNEWNGMRKMQMVIQDIAVNDWQLFDHRGRLHVDFTPYIGDWDHCMVIGDVDMSPLPQGLIHTNYKQAKVMTGEGIDTLFLLEMPDTIDQLEQVMTYLQPDNIHLCFHVKNSAFTSVFPTRDDFIWLYAMVRKIGKINLKTDLERIQNAKGWHREQILFMSHVFFELEFVKIDGSMMYWNQTPMKKDLQDSTIYQERLQKMEIEKKLYYSNYRTLQTLFARFMGSRNVSREEIAYGL